MRNYFLTILMIVGVVIFFVDSSHAMDTEFQLRLDTGILFYSMEMDAHSKTVLTKFKHPFGSNDIKEKEQFGDTMPFVAAGGTLFFNRIFIDLSGQYAFDGDDHSAVLSSAFNETNQDGTSFFIGSSNDMRGSFDRTDYAVAVGYAVTQRLSVFAGYKWAHTDLDLILNNRFGMRTIDEFTFHGNIETEGELAFKYEGLFIGIAHGWPIERFFIFEGLFSINAGMAQLSSKFTRNQTGTIRVDSINGQPIEPIVDSYAETEFEKGDTIGLGLSLNWQGVTSIKNLSYSMGLSGYRYRFEQDKSDSPGISESSLILKLGVSYAF